MQTGKKLVHSWLPVVAAFLIGAMLVGTAVAATTTFKGTVKARNFKYTKPKTNNYVIPGSAFVAGVPSSNPDHGDYSGAVTLAAGEEAVAALSLPQGAVVTRVRVWHGTQAAGDWTLHLEANDDTGGHDDMTSFDASLCSATPCSTTSTTISPNTVNNKTRGYGLWLDNNTGGSSITVYRVVITYQTTSVGPASLKVGADFNGLNSRLNG